MCEICADLEIECSLQLKEIQIFIMMKTNEMNGTYTKEEKEYVPEILIVIMRAVSCIIVLLNASVLICLLRWRRTFPNDYWYQIVCITCNDILAGLSSFIMSFVDWPFFGDHIVACSITVGPFFITQCATLYNILAICINRFVVLKGLKRRQNLWKKVHTIYGTMAAWTASILLCSAPFAIWSDPIHFSRYRFCSMKGIFDEHVGSAMKILLGSFLIPLVLTDVLYCFMFVVLKREFKIMHATKARQKLNLTVFSGGENDCEASTPGRSTVSKEGFNDGESRTHRCQEVQTEVSTTSCGVSTGVQCSACEYSQPFKTSKPMLNSDSKNDTEHDSTTVCYQEKVNGQFESGLDVLEYTEFFQNGNLGTNSSGMKRKRNTVPILRVRKAFWLLGLILIALNVFSWPGLTALLLGAMTDSFHISRSLILPLFATLSLNSVVNPILYTVRVSEFREAFCRTFLNSCSKTDDSTTTGV